MSSAVSLIAGVLLSGLVERFRNVGKLVLGIFMDMMETGQCME